MAKNVLCCSVWQQQFTEFEKWQSNEKLDENTGGFGRTLQS
jgi:hypothetical protein